MKITKRKAKGVLADMIANMDEDSLAKTREKMVGMSYHNTDIAACGHATCPSRESCLRWVLGRRMDDYQSFGSFQPRGAASVSFTAGHRKELNTIMTTTMESKITRAIIELADNGYIMHSDDLLLVYTNKMDNGYRDMIADIMQDLDNAIEAGGCNEFRVKVEVEPITEDEHGTK